ncbi:HlyD family secretion protein [Nitrosophilus kaiyonis]|uniref:HlyD family secretion protein n=1 Tax=Nitrosophilus kaiyonis TaxID=2930200 RepID=UPI0024902018|nr:HlyD family efflux transporter periplasmic adaptor subunit [Nitrosophilus kaiyonis]
MAKKIGTATILFLIFTFGYIGFDYLHYRKINAVSDAAFIKSDKLVTLNFKVGGKVIKMNKKENDSVKKGELLAKIDPTDFINIKEKLIFQKKALKKQIESMELKKKRLKKTLKLKTQIAKKDIEALNKEIKAKKFQIEANLDRFEKLKKDEKRFFELFQKKLISQDRYEKIHTQKLALQKEIKAKKLGVFALIEKQKEAKKNFELNKNEQKVVLELEKNIKSLKEKLNALKKSIEEIGLKLSYTKLYAPFDAVIAKKFFDAPKVVKKGEPIYALTDPKSLYCEVLLSEKKLKGVKPGNSVKIEVDAIPNKTYTGVVESIAPTSASTFSLVPRDIASGEFTKLDQRFKVRIKLDNIQGLRAGMGASVAIKRE